MKLNPILFPMAILLGGCVADDVAHRPAYEYKGILSFEDIAPTSGPEYFRGADPVAEHRVSWTAEELAFRAGQRCGQIKDGALSVAAKRLKMDESFSWKNPELRYGHDFEDGGDGSDNFKARLYIPNPFVDRYLRRQEEANIAIREAKACADAFAVYSEVKLLCNDAVALGKRIKLMEQKLQLRTDLVDLEQKRFDKGVSKTPYELLRAKNRQRNSEGKLAEMIDKERRIKAEIALLAELPYPDFTIADIQINPSKTLDDIPALCEIAFSRRPDLAAAIRELDAAEAKVGEVQARNLPWFRYVEAGYAKSSGTDSETGASDTDHEYGVEVALTIPIFDWCGNRVSFAKSVRERASDCVDSLYQSIRREVETAVQEYWTMQGLCESSEDDSYIENMRRKIDAVDLAGGKKDDDKCLAQLELIDLEISILDRLTDAKEAYLQLESVVGGPLR